MSPTMSQPITIEVCGIRLSGLLAVPGAEPRAVIVALPGAGMRAGYFDGPVERDSSLLALGAANGFSVLALDRPGYGESVGAPEELLTLFGQVGVLHQALDVFAAGNPIGAGYFLAAHSYGLKLGLAAAADPRGERFLGLDGAGSGLRYQTNREAPELADGRRDRGAPWGPEDLYPAGTFEKGCLPSGRMPGAEVAEMAEWPDVLRGFAGDIRIPLRFTYGDHERLWMIDDATLSELRGLFPAAPWVSVELIEGAGHNVSLSCAAPKYHRRVLHFARECVARALG